MLAYIIDRAARLISSTPPRIGETAQADLAFRKAEANGSCIPLATACSVEIWRLRRVSFDLLQSGAPGGDSCLLSGAPLLVVDGRGNRIRKPLQP